MLDKDKARDDKPILDYLPDDLKNSELAQKLKDVEVKDLKMALSKLNYDFYGTAKSNCERIAREALKTEFGKDVKKEQTCTLEEEEKELTKRLLRSLFSSRVRTCFDHPEQLTTVLQSNLLDEEDDKSPFANKIRQIETILGFNGLTVGHIPAIVKWLSTPN